MKTKYGVKLLPLAMAGLLLFTGCGSSANTKSSTETGKNVTEQSSKEQTDAANSDEMVTFTFSKVAYPNATLPDGQTSDNNVVIDYIRDKYNVDLVLDWQAESSEYNNKLSLNIASGSLPDIFYCDDYKTFLQLAENGLLADLTGIYSDNISDTMKAIDESYNGRNLLPVTVDGKIMAVPAGNLDGQQDVLWLRKDWLDNLGLSVPTTIQELETVLTAFVNDDPDGNGIDDTVGLVVDATEPVAGYNHQFGLEPIFYAFGAYPTYWMNDVNNEVYFGSTSENMKQALELLSDWYSKGLIDKQFATRIGTGETEAVFTSGQSGAYFGAVHANYTDAFTNNNDIELVAVNAPLSQDGKYNYVLPSPVSSMLCISSKCKDPAKALEIIGITNDLYRGFDEEANQIMSAANIASSSSGRRAIFPTGALTLDYFDIIEKLGAATKENIETGSYTEYNGITQYDKDQVVLATQFADGSDKSELSFKAYYYRYVGSQLLSDKALNPLDAAYYYSTESSSSLQSVLDTFEQEMYLKIIIGEKDINYFDEFASKWFAMGGQTILDEVKEVVNK